MELLRKLEILADAAKYDVACTSSGVERKAKGGQLGAASPSGCCHSFTPDGRCVTLLKVLYTNCCVYDCAYCVNRKSNDVPRAAFSPRELADLTIEFYRRNYIEGLFISSGVIVSPDRTMELMSEAMRILRIEYGFRGYIHAKAVPGASPELVEQMGFLADRMSVNMELPSEESLKALCPQKDRASILAPMRQIKEGVAEDKESKAIATRNPVTSVRARAKKAQRAFVPAGQSTQMIIGATPESDLHILSLSSSLYRNFNLKRVFFSAYLPVSQDARLPQGGAVQLDREHRLYQADWLMRFYSFAADEIVSEKHPFLDIDLDPKAYWAINHLETFPVEVNTAPYELLLRVPGIGVRGAKLIVRARKSQGLDEQKLRKLGIAFKRAKYFITCGGKYQGKGTDFTTEALRAVLKGPIDGGKHGRRSARVHPNQLTLF
ncbi:putative DNA modification/repair radical SAM protein [Slackia heliotrinireducens]|uniref:Predicted DNA-binding protein with the helix-hairpin-helix motif n=1 Tax=Slackia heliotrinireducens (strain ATCC 29202 / DSM 20476 / NCTC 11029 / RHS 1) TaxID=471855 RepID=C7N6M0_SLAHD|nr:putative DNA modification/repair radical SAM protein [Slackia heliotrinireducens]ACV22555.1 predicted DNA-binding protein with the helix-hairpin-helix motif [Slackia heliotrinireducens DSM 20476]VEH01023.1 putative DNA modification/repair radical SAM protein [Slackia heliotrinireducens]